MQKIILIIEDQKSIAQYLQIKLSSVVDYPVLIAGTVAEAKGVLESGVRVLVCLSDLNLPDAKEYEAIALLQQFHVPTVVLTASYNDKTRQQMFNNRVADYVVKDGPSAIDYAVNTVGRLLKNSNKVIWLITSTSMASASTRLIGLLKIQRYPVKVFDDYKTAQKELISEAAPDLIMISSVEDINNDDVVSFVSFVRERFTPNQVPLLFCGPTEKIPVAIKLMKYGVNDFYNTNFSEEELFVRLNQNIEQAQSYKEIEHISQTDGLTQLFNRGYFFNFGERYFASSLKKQNKTFVVMADIDHFKNVNDTYGHQKGDEAIVFTAKTLKTCFEKYAVARFGGEEFCVLGEAQSVEQISALCEDFRSQIESSSLKETDVSFTVSLGVSFEGKSLDEAIHSADVALYFSKENGRNQVSDFTNIKES